jgi:glycogen debranching enzyme
MRHGEMAALGQIPFGRYYGTVDGTPLFLLLLAETFHATGDLHLCRELWPAAERALAWCQTYGDVDGDGFLEYAAGPGAGLHNQGWKDSHDSVSYSSGELVHQPVALCEVQGYYYAGLRGMAAVAAALANEDGGHWRDVVAELNDRAGRLRERFNAAFWLADKRFIALGLDGDKRQVDTVASNAGHCLWTGIVAAEHADAVAKRLLAPDMFSGWGLRTLSSAERRYDPVSYHNGSVWPHDTAIAALGLARYGFHTESRRLAQALLDAAAQFPFGRLPELFGGQERVAGQPPVEYPEACSPQAWAAGAPFMLWQAMELGKGGGR